MVVQFVCLSVNSGSRRFLCYNRQNRHEPEEDDDLNPFKVPPFFNFGLFSRKGEKTNRQTALLERTFGPHPLI